jgi:hypothetical protein
MCRITAWRAVWAASRRKSSAGSWVTISLPSSPTRRDVTVIAAVSLSSRTMISPGAEKAFL